MAAHSLVVVAHSLVVVAHSPVVVAHSLVVEGSPVVVDNQAELAVDNPRPDREEAYPPLWILRSSTEAVETVLYSLYHTLIAPFGASHVQDNSKVIFNPLIRTVQTKEHFKITSKVRIVQPSTIYAFSVFISSRDFVTAQPT